MLPVDEIIYGDSLNVLPTFPDESVHCILTDPPWMISREVTIHRAANLKYKGPPISLDIAPWDKQWVNRQEYLDWCYKWLAECVRILQPDRHLLFFFDKRNISYVVDYLEDLGCKFRGCLSWIKSNPCPRARQVNFLQSTESCLWFTKGLVKRQWFNWSLGQQLDYVVAPIPCSHSKKEPRVHPTQKPGIFPRVYLSYLSNEGEIVLDPFCGSGIFLIEAAKMKRHYIGVDCEEQYVIAARERLSRIASEVQLF